MEKKTKYLWLFPREDFDYWKDFAKDAAMDTYEEYVESLAKHEQSLKAVGINVVRVRISCGEMNLELERRGLTNDAAARVLVLRQLSTSVLDSSDIAAD